MVAHVLHADEVLLCTSATNDWPIYSTRSPMPSPHQIPRIEKQQRQHGAVDSKELSTSPRPVLDSDASQ